MRKIKDKEIWRRMSRKLSKSSDEIEDAIPYVIFLFFLKHSVSSTNSQIPPTYIVDLYT